MEYRHAATKCELCCKELAAGEQLEPLVGLQVCPGCRSGPPLDAARAWRVELLADEDVHQKQSRYDTSYVKSTVHIVPPTRWPFGVQFRSESEARRAGFGGGDDHVLGDPAFDDKVWIESMRGDGIEELLAEHTVRAAAVEAVAAAGWVVVNEDGIEISTVRGSISIEDFDAIDRGGILLAIAIERWVRGAPGSAPRRAGCVERPAEERARGGGSAHAKYAQQQGEAPPVDPVYYKKDKPGPPCPECGELLTNAGVEYICKRCGHTRHRPDVAARRRTSAIKTTLIVILLLSAVVALIILGTMMEA